MQRGSWFRRFGVVGLLLGLLSGLGCQKEAAAPPPDPNKLLWRQLGLALAEENLARIAVLRVEDKVAQSPDVERQVQQVILGELTQLPDVMVLETDQSVVTKAIEAHQAELAIGIPAPMAMELCQALSVDAFLYVTVENTEYDASVKIYIGSSGTVVFTKTLEDLALPGGDTGAPLVTGTTETVAMHPDGVPAQDA